MPPRSSYHIISGGGDAFFSATEGENAPSGADGPQFRKQRTIYVGNFPRSLTEHALILLCQEYGVIERVHYAWHTIGELKGLPKGFAFVEYTTVEDAQRAISNLQGKEVEGRVLRADWYHENADEGAGSTAKTIASTQKRTAMHESAILAAVEGWDADDDVELFGLGPLETFRAKMEDDLPKTGGKMKDEHSRSDERAPRDGQRDGQQARERARGASRERDGRYREQDKRQDRGRDHDRDRDRDRERRYGGERGRGGDRGGDRERARERGDYARDEYARRSGGSDRGYGDARGRDRDDARGSDRGADRGGDRYEAPRGDRHREGDRRSDGRDDREHRREYRDDREDRGSRGGGGEREHRSRW